MAVRQGLGAFPAPKKAIYDVSLRKDVLPFFASYPFRALNSTQAPRSKNAMLAARTLLIVSFSTYCLAYYLSRICSMAFLAVSLTDFEDFATLSSTTAMLSPSELENTMSAKPLPA